MGNWPAAYTLGDGQINKAKRENAYSLADSADAPLTFNNDNQRSNSKSSRRSEYRFESDDGHLARPCLRTMDSDRCTGTALAGITSTIAFASVALTWWVVELPELFFKHPQGHNSENDNPSRPWRFIRGLSWNCIRALQPCYILLLALAGGRYPQQWAVIYYFGHCPDRQRITSFTRWEWAKIALTDGVALIGEILLVLETTLISKNDVTGFSKGMWLLSIMPSAIFGPYLILLGAIKKSPPLGRAWFGFLLAILIGLGLILGIYFSSNEREPAIAAAMTAQYAVTLLPFAISSCCPGGCMCLPLLFSAILRIMPFVIGVSLTYPGYFWFCALNRSALGAVVGILGGFLVLSFAMLGSRYAEFYRPDFQRAMKAQRRRDEESTPLQEVESRRPANHAEEAGGSSSAGGGVGGWFGGLSATINRAETLLPSYGEAIVAPPAFDGLSTLSRRQTAPPTYEEVASDLADNGESATGAPSGIGGREMV